MFRGSVAVTAAVLGVLSLAGSAGANELVDTNVTERVECMFRVYFDEGGANGLECLS